MARHDTKNDLHSFVAGLQDLLNSDPGYETIAAPGVARWVIEAMTAYVQGKHSSLDQAFGITRPRRRPSADELDDVPPNLVKAWRMALAGKSWSEIAEAIAYRGDPNDLGRKVRRHHTTISRIEADRMIQKWKEEDGGRLFGGN